MIGLSILTIPVVESLTLMLLKPLGPALFDPDLFGIQISYYLRNRNNAVLNGIGVYKSGASEDKDNFRKQQVQYNKLIEDSKKNYFTHALNNSEPRETFKTLRILLNRNEKILPSLYTPEELGNEFAESFLGKVETIRSSFESSNTYIVDCSCNSCSPVPLNKSKPKQFGNFTELTQDEVRSIIMKCANKTCNLDTLPIWLVKGKAEVVLPCITDIVNPSLREGIFPEMMKQVIVTPSLKKTNSY